jgi:hypothetical protein
MQIAYFDESGDDGFPRYSSPLFVLSAVYLHYLNWQPGFERLRDFRRSLKTAHNLPVKWELHTRDFALNKKPYLGLNMSDADRVAILDEYCDLVGNLDLKIINVVIVKPHIANPKYQVLDTALKYSVQRIENDLDPAQNPQSRFLIITDPGRVGKMRSTTRRVQRINYIPSKFGQGSYRREIRSLIEDPLEKESKESYFIQVADLVAYVVFLYGTGIHLPGRTHGRLPALITSAKVRDWLDRMKPSFNLRASSKDPYGIMFHP